MSSQPGAPDAPPPDGGDEESRLHIRAITELPAGHDAELATIFREMRRAADISAEQMAGRLATPIETIQALESGALLGLPEWSELTRIVSAYAAMLGLDSRPILRRLEGQLGVSQSTETTPAPAEPEPSTPASTAAKPAASASPSPSGPPMPPSAAMPPPLPGAATPPPRPSPLRQPSGAIAPPPSQPQAQSQQSAGPASQEPEKKSKGRLAGLTKTLLNWFFLVGFVAALGSGVWYAAKHPRMVWTTLDTLPEPIPRLMRSVWNFMRPLDNKPARPQISDPDNRKSDKLP